MKPFLRLSLLGVVQLLSQHPARAARLFPRNRTLPKKNNLFGNLGHYTAAKRRWFSNKNSNKKIVIAEASPPIAPPTAYHDRTTTSSANTADGICGHDRKAPIWRRQVTNFLKSVGQTGLFLVVSAPLVAVMLGPFFYLLHLFWKGLIAVHGT